MNVTTEKYKGYTIIVDYDQFGTDPASNGNFEIVPRDQYTDGDDELLETVDEQMEQGKMWPITHFTHGGQSSYDLTTDTDHNWGWIVFSDEYAGNFHRVDDRRVMARQDLEEYTQWANGEVYFVQVRDPYGDLVDDDGQGMGDIIGLDYALDFGRQVVDSDNINYATKAKYAGDLHR